MGLKTWMARKGNVGGTARAVAKGWNTFKSQNPDMKPIEIAKAYINLRYGTTGESNLEAEALEVVDNGPIRDPLSLSWGIFVIENKDELGTMLEYEREWKQIMREELQKAGVEPDAQYEEQVRRNTEKTKQEKSKSYIEIWGVPNSGDFQEMCEMAESWLSKYSHIDVIAGLVDNFCNVVMNAAETSLNQGVSKNTIQELFDDMVFHTLSKAKEVFEALGLIWNYQVLQPEDEDFDDFIATWGRPNFGDVQEMTGIVASWLSKYPHIDIVGAITTSFCTAIVIAAETCLDDVGEKHIIQKMFDAMAFEPLSRAKKDLEALGLVWKV